MNGISYLSLFALLFLSLVPASFQTDLDDYDDSYEDNADFSSNSTANGTLIFIKELTNLTKDEGTKVIKLICEVQSTNPDGSGGKVKFEWLKNKAPVEKEKRISIKSVREKEHKFRSTLRITNADQFDRGFYECVARNDLERIQSQGLLEINTVNGRFVSTAAINTLKFDGGSDDGFGEITTLSSDNSGAVFDANLIDREDRKILKSQFDLTSTGKMLNNIEAGVVRDNVSATEPFCQIYAGKTCQQYLENKYVFIQPPYTQSDIEHKLGETFLVISQSKDISLNCNRFARPSLCFSAFPLCTDPLKVNTIQAKQKNWNDRGEKKIRNVLSNWLRRICKHDCILLETELCSKEYAIAKRHPVIAQTLELERCELLPEETDDGLTECLSLGVDQQNINKDDNCYWDNGEFYRGVQDISESNKKCLRWSHQFHVSLSEHPELIGHNYCRNPGGIAQQPFCFVDQNKKEVCQITKCAQVVGLYVAVSFLVVSATVGIIFALFCCRRRGKIARNLQNMNVPTANKNIYGNPGPNSPMEMNNLLPPNIPPQRNHHPHKNGYQNVTQYTYKELVFVEELGEGAFGKVYKGELKTKSGKIFVAVKSLKENASEKTMGDFQREIELISELKHPNIICLMGVVIKQEPMCMLFEFMSEGDLHEFLIANSPGEGKSLTQNQFLHIAIQISQGMEYLSDNHYVHRDLAARNCLVSQDLVVKISDFGLSRDMYSCDYYRVQSKSLLPVRWMPPESILYGKFTTESDVWSYGIVLWEIYSYGLQPYYGYNNQEVINMIRYRKLLPCPDACPSYCYALMVECWAELAIRRPKFGEISHRLRVWKQNGTCNGAYFKTPDHHTKCTNQASSSSDQVTVCASTKCNNDQAEPCSTWERKLDRTRLNESQSSLTSRSSSLGNKTQSTSLSNEARRERRARKATPEDAFSPKNTIVNSNGDNIEIKITQ